MKKMKKTSEMMIAIGGDILNNVVSQEEMQAHLNMVKNAWNISCYPEKRRKIKLKRYIKNQKPYAPSEESLKGLEWEIRRMMKQKIKYFPTVNSKIKMAEAIEVSQDNYIIRAYFTNDKDYI
jgi:BioD-like phosphotransacetylase family protein